MIYRENAVYLLPRERQQRRKGRQNIGTDKLIPEKNAIFLNVMLTKFGPISFQS